MRFLGIYREEIFSPGRVHDDTAIMDATLTALKNEGHEVEVARAEMLDGRPPHAQCVLTMAQSDRVLDVLERWREFGVRIVNAVAAVRSCNRAPLIRLLADARLPMPSGRILPIDDAKGSTMFQFDRPYWVKRGDAHRVDQEDVLMVTSQGEFEAALRHFRNNRVPQILVQEHVEGEVIKFYGVRGGLEEQKRYFAAFPDGEDAEITDRLLHLTSLVERAAAVVGLEVYGGDIVITCKGMPLLIDVNAWPSFSRCRREAAHNIARYILATFASLGDRAVGLKAMPAG